MPRETKPPINTPAAGKPAGSGFVPLAPVTRQEDLELKPATKAPEGFLPIKKKP
jgi:hypothetical protein